ncbi:DUF2878 domain-containing protein [Pontibacterium granulatum]|uniref:DUF2878 domain-containing protein n=1 Tax=Pontibacterium granulatum TaxID=2036029 RepID=UPI00249A6486|nr:DUF2878 domain-containing protein [Pontibacterium granulatum]MDI3324105.1 DUF2878 domain-containing protein [Pontibacterium granulatum]
MFFTGLTQIFWVNLVGFQMVWWLSILGRDTTQSIIFLLLVIHLMLHARPRHELKVVIICGILGYAIDTALTYAGVFVFKEHGGGVYLPPLWLLLLWFGFSATLRQSLVFFVDKLPLASVCGAIAGSLTYLAAVNLGAVQLGYSTHTSAYLIAVIWAILFPFLVWLSDRLGEFHVVKHT